MSDWSKKLDWRNPANLPTLCPVHGESETLLILLGSNLVLSGHASKYSDEITWRTSDEQLYDVTPKGYRYLDDPVRFEATL